MIHNDVIKWNHFPRYWPFVREIHRSAMNSPHKGQWRGALMFSLTCAWMNDWVNNRGARDLRRHRAHYDVIIINEPCFSSHSVNKCTSWLKHRPLLFTCQNQADKLILPVVFHVSKSNRQYDTAHCCLYIKTKQTRNRSLLASKLK